MKNRKTSKEKTNAVIRAFKICKGKVSDIVPKYCSNTIMELDNIATREMGSEITLALPFENLRQL